MKISVIKMSKNSSHSKPRSRSPEPTVSLRTQWEIDQMTEEHFKPYPEKLREIVHKHGPVNSKREERKVNVERKRMEAEHRKSWEVKVDEIIEKNYPGKKPSGAKVEKIKKTLPIKR